MNLPDTLTDRQKEAVKAYFDSEQSETHAAEKLCIDVKALRSHLYLAAKKGVSLCPSKFSAAAPAGWECNFSTIQHKDGEIIQQWDRVRPIINTEELSEYLKNRIPASKIDFPPIDRRNNNLMLEWPIYDAHHGMLAWAKETGADYDSKISRHLQISAAKILYQSFGKVEQTVIIFGGDNQTSDNRAGITEKSHNSLDTDTRFQNIAWCSYETAFTCIDIAAQFSRLVLVLVLSGNHDYHSAIHLAIQLHAHYRNCQNITVDISPEIHRFYSWGHNVFMATHGNVNEKRIGSFALQQAIRRGYGADKDMQLYVRMGHLHKRGQNTPGMLVEDDGVIIERFPTLAAQEAYSIEGAYTSVRATEARLWHKTNKGKAGSREITLGEILERYPYQES